MAKYVAFDASIFLLIAHEMRLQFSVSTTYGLGSSLRWVPIYEEHHTKSCLQSKNKTLYGRM